MSTMANTRLTATATLLLLSTLLVRTIDARTIDNVMSKIGVSPQNNNVTQPGAIFILAGQSNMAGRGSLLYDKIKKQQYFFNDVPPEYGPDPSKIFRLNKDLGWEVAEDPLHVGIDTKVCGVGPGMTFANKIKERIGSTIGLVPCAVGNTEISQWQRGEFLYERMVQRAKVAARGGGVIKALLWYQGEADTCSIDRVNHYKEKLERLIQDIRQDLNFPSLPIIQVALATGAGSSAPCTGSVVSPNDTCVENIRKIQKAINLPNVVTLDAIGLGHNGHPDEVHLSTQGQIVLGGMMADAYLNNFLGRA